MSEHERLSELLSAAAAGALSVDEDRRLRAHLPQCEACAAEIEALQDLAGSLRSLPTPQAPDVLVARVRRLMELELATREDEKLNRLIMAFLLLFSWTVTLASLFTFQLLSGEVLTVWGALESGGVTWSIGYFAVAWTGGALALVVLGVYARRKRRVA